MADYLYNGVILPELPKTDLPYAYVTHQARIIPMAANFYYCYFSSKAFTYGDTGLGAGDGVHLPDGENTVVYYLLDNQNYSDAYLDGVPINTWLPYTVEANYSWDNPIWTNTDILTEDGTLYLAATEPIPLTNQTIIEWDGVTDGLESISYTLPDGVDADPLTRTYYKVADVAPSLEQLKGGYTVVSSTAEEVGTVLTTGENANYDYFEDGAVYGTAGWLVKDGAVWLHRYTDGADKMQFVTILTYLTAVSEVDPVSFMVGYRLGQLARSKRK